MLQLLIILTLFTAASGYVGFQIYKAFSKKSGCASGCGKCGVDFTKIEQQLRREA